MNDLLSQTELDGSKAWKDYKSFYLKLNTVKTLDDVNKLSRAFEKLATPLYALFRGNKVLISDITSFSTQMINDSFKRVKPIIGNGPRMPKPDFKKDMAESLNNLKRNFRIVDFFHRFNLQDEFVMGIENGLSRSISSLRQSLQRQSPQGSDPAVESELQSMEDTVNAWYTQDVEKGRKPPRKIPDQGALDKSEAWSHYDALHRKVRIAKSDSDLASVQVEIRDLDSSLGKLFADSALVQHLAAWITLECNTKRDEMLHKTSLKKEPESWADFRETFESLKLQFKIAQAFFEKDLYHPLVGTMASNLAPKTLNFKSAFKLVEGKPTSQDQIQEIESFLKSAEAAFKVWKKKKL